jgi:hypothetical protein
MFRLFLFHVLPQNNIEQFPPPHPTTAGMELFCNIRM